MVVIRGCQVYSLEGKENSLNNDTVDLRVKWL